jgi:hypothetical protein
MTVLSRKANSIIMMILLIAAGDVRGMNQPQKSLGLMAYFIQVVGDIRQWWITEPLKPFPFEQLPIDLQKHVLLLLSVDSQVKSFKDAAYSFNSFARVNKDFYALLCEPVFCFDLIKNVARAVKCSDITGAKAFKMPEARRRVSIQNKLQFLCSSSMPSKDTFDKLYSDGVDLEFGYFWYTNEHDWLSPLMLAARNNKKITVGWLLEKGVNINQANHEGKTALMYAFEGIVPQLLAVEGIAINQQDIYGDTALMYHIRNGGKHGTSVEIIQKLLSAGADPVLGNYYGMMPLKLAQEHMPAAPERLSQIVTLLENIIAKRMQPSST